MLIALLIGLATAELGLAQERVKCGDGTCDPEERCWSCEEDCSPCVKEYWVRHFSDYIRDSVMDKSGRLYVLIFSSVVRLNIQGISDWLVHLPSDKIYGDMVLSEDDKLLVLIERQLPDILVIDVESTLVRQDEFEPGASGRTMFGPPSLRGSSLYLTTRLDDPSGPEKIYFLVIYDIMTGEFDSTPLAFKTAVAHPTLLDDGGILLLATQQSTSMEKLFLLSLHPSAVERWRVQIGEGIPEGSPIGYSTAGAMGPIVTRDGTILVWTARGEIQQYSQEGKLLWEIARPAALFLGPVLCSDDQVIFCTQNGEVYSVDKHGAPRWIVDAIGEPDPESGHDFITSLTCLQHEHVIMRRHTDNLSVLDSANGSLLYSIPVVEFSQSGVLSAHVTPENTLLIVDGEYRVMSWLGPYVSLGTSSWPRPRSDSGNRCATVR
jgi:hypothetical protein